MSERRVPAGKAATPRKTTAAARGVPARTSAGARPAARPGTGKTGAARRPAASASARPRAKARPVRGVGGFLAKLTALTSRKSAKPRKKAAARRQLPRELSILLTVVLCGAIIAMGALLLRHIPQYREFQKMRDAVQRSTFYDGTDVDGIDVSGMTLRQAQEYWGDQIEPGYANRTVSITNVQGRSVTAAELGYSSDYLMVLAHAWESARSGSLQDRYREVTERSGSPASYTVTRSFYDEDLVDRYVKAAAKNLNIEPTEPKITSFDMDNYAFVFSDGTLGQHLDEEKMAADICNTLDNGSGSITLSLNVVQPQTKAEDISGNYGLIASARTDASTSSPERLNNLRVALASINGASVKPGATFSFNQAVGQRTVARGYKAAHAYASGEVVDEVGGGICQVSTTLFNAVAKSDLQITERHNHTMPVGYVAKGKDATVDWGRLDFKFTNNTDTEIYIAAMLNSDKRVVVGIFGKKLPDGRYITVESVTTGTEDYETLYEENAALPPGTQSVKQEGRKGYLAEAYKIVWDKDGNQLSRTLLCKSHYFAREEIVEFNG